MVIDITTVTTIGMDGTEIIGGVEAITDPILVGHDMVVQGQLPEQVLDSEVLDLAVQVAFRELPHPFAGLVHLVAVVA